MTGVPRNPQVLQVVLLGIDGAGKTTAARAVIRELQQQGIEGELFRNPGGRRTLNRWAARHAHTAEGLLGPRLLDAVESGLRGLAVLRSTLQARRRCGVVLFDRHLQCQLALRQVRGLPSGVLLPWLLRGAESAAALRAELEALIRRSIPAGSGPAALALQPLPMREGAQAGQ